MTLAQTIHARGWGDMSTWGIGDFAIALIVICAICAVAYVALNYFDVTIPPWVVRIFWILVVAFVCIAAIRLLMRM
jgi:uncharacterized membrane protein YbhN (UPF0104 family)